MARHRGRCGSLGGNVGAKVGGWRSWEDEMGMGKWRR